MQSKLSSYINGFDWVRALMSVAVVTWHLKTFGTSALFTESFAAHRFGVRDFINFHILLVAVPAFMLISCYLHVRKEPSLHDLRRQVFRLALLAVFWTVALNLWRGGYLELRTLVPHSFFEALTLILSAAGEYYYFFVSLLIVTVIAFGFSKLHTRWSVIGFAASALLLFFLPQIALASEQVILVYYWSPLNFLPYPFLAILIYRYQPVLLSNGRRLMGIALALTAAAVLLAWYEWTHYVNAAFLIEGVAFVTYTRLSLVFEAAALTLLALWPALTSNAVIRFMSLHSLGLYILHPFFKPIVMLNVRFASLPDLAESGLQAALVIFLSYAFSLLAASVFKDDLIR
jgi:hypothetical protein